MATIASMVFNIEARTASIEDAAKKTVDVVESMKQSMLGTIVSADLLSDAIEKFAELSVDALKSVAEGLVGIVEHAEALGNSLFEMSLKTGASVENLSALRFVASQTGINFDSFNTTLYKMEQALGSTGAKADTMSAQLARIGLDLQTLKNESPDQAFIDIIAGLEAIPNRADQASIGMAVFGRGFKEMAGLTQESITELIDQAKDLGLVMSTETAAAAHVAEISWNSLEMQFEAVAMRIGATVLPALAALERLAGEAFQELLSDWQKSGSSFSDATVQSAVLRIGEALIQATAAMAGFAQGAIEGLKDVTAFAVRTGEAIVNVGYAAIKVTSLGTATEEGKGLAAQALRGLHDAYDALEVLKGGFNASADVASTAFATVENVADRMSGRFADAYKSTQDEIAKMADQSHKAFGGTSTDADEATKKVKEHSDGWAELTKNIEASEHASVSAATAIGKSLKEQDVLLTLGQQMGTIGLKGFTPTVTDSTTKRTQEALEKSFNANIGLMPDLTDQARQHIDAATESTNKWADTFKQFPALLTKAFEGGGGLDGAIKALGVKIGENLFGKDGALSGLSDKITGGLSSLFGDTIGGALGSMLPGLGGLISKGLDALWGGIKQLFGGPSKEELQGRDIEKQFEQSFGGTQGIDGFQKMAAAISAAYAATGRSAAQANTDVLALFAAEKKGADATTDAVKKIQQALDDQKKDQADLQTAIQKYGFTIDQLGPAMRRQQLTEQAVGLENDFRLLVGSGIDVNLVLDKMGKGINDFVQTAQRTGTEIPAEMKPMLQKMIDLGTLVDANGNKITNLDESGLTFSETMTQGFDRIVTALKAVTAALTGVKDGVNAIPGSKTIDVNYNIKNPPTEAPDAGITAGPVFTDSSVPADVIAHRGAYIGSSAIERFHSGTARVLPFPSMGLAGDERLAILQTGEAVLSRNAVSAVGLDAIRALNRGGTSGQAATAGTSSSGSAMRSQTGGATAVTVPLHISGVKFGEVMFTVMQQNGKWTAKMGRVLSDHIQVA